MNLLLRIALEK